MHIAPAKVNPDPQDPVAKGEEEAEFLELTGHTQLGTHRGKMAKKLFLKQGRR